MRGENSRVGCGGVGVLSPWTLEGRDPRAGSLERGNCSPGPPGGGGRGDEGKKCHQLEPRLEGDSFWMGVGPLLKMLSPSPEPADRLRPAFAQQSEGLRGCV